MGSCVEVWIHRDPASAIREYTSGGIYSKVDAEARQRVMAMNKFGSTL